MSADAMWLRQHTSSIAHHMRRLYQILYLMHVALSARAIQGYKVGEQGANTAQNSEQEQLYSLNGSTPLMYRISPLVACRVSPALILGG